MIVLWRRFLARFTDYFIFWLLFMLGFVIFLLFHLTNILNYWTSFIIFSYLIYSTISHFINGQTYGKKILSLKLVTESGKKLGFWQVLIREILIVIILTSSTIYQIIQGNGYSLNINQNIVVNILIALVMVDLLFAFFNDKYKMLHDILPNTKVINT